MAAIKKSIEQVARDAFAAGATGRLERRIAAREAEADALAESRRREAATTSELRALRLAVSVNESCIERGITSAVDRKRIVNLVANEQARCAKTGETFDLRFAVAQAVHKAKTAKGEPSVAPVAPNGPRPGARPMTFAERVAEDEQFRARLRALGIEDPRFGTAGNLGPLSGGPIGGK